jgi:putative transposase
LFIEDRNYSYFLQLLEKHLLLFPDIYAYALIPNHFHLFVKVGEELEIRDGRKSSLEINEFLSNQFRKLFIAYATGMSNVYYTHGGLFETPFRRIEVNTDSYFTQTCYYLHYNPVHHGMCNHPSSYINTSFLPLLSDAPTILMRDEVMDWFGGRDIFIKYHEMQNDNYRKAPFYME